MKETITYSLLSMFACCHKKCEYRYVNNIVPAATPDYFTFGSAFHKALELWFKPNDLASILDAENNSPEGITRYKRDNAIGAISQFNLSDEDRIKCEALFDAYISTYSRESFAVIDVEKTFKQPLLSPKGKASRFFTLQGKVDALIKENGRYFVMEHKTTSKIDEGYINRILIDSQILIYAIALEKELGIKISGALYDVAQKPLIRMKQEESIEDFEARKAALIAKSKTGKSSATRQKAETEEQFYDRCMNSIGESSFYREYVLFSDEMKSQAIKDIWSISKDYRLCKKEGNFYKNTLNCNLFGSSCVYLPLCRCFGNLEQCKDIYTQQEPHKELKDG